MRFIFRKINVGTSYAYFEKKIAYNIDKKSLKFNYLLII